MSFDPSNIPASQRQRYGIGDDSGESGSDTDDTDDGGSTGGSGGGGDPYTVDTGPSTEERIEASRGTDDGDGAGGTTDTTDGSTGGGSTGGSGGGDDPYTVDTGPSTEERIEASRDAGDSDDGADRTTDTTDGSTGGDDGGLTGEQARQAETMGYGTDPLIGEEPEPRGDRPRDAGGPGAIGDRRQPERVDVTEGGRVIVRDPRTDNLYYSGGETSGIRGEQFSEAPEGLVLPGEPRPPMQGDPAIETPSTGAEAQRQAQELEQAEEEFGPGADRAFLGLQGETLTDVSPDDLVPTTGGLGLDVAATQREQEARAALGSPYRASQLRAPETAAPAPGAVDFGQGGPQIALTAEQFSEQATAREAQEAVQGMQWRNQLGVGRFDTDDSASAGLDLPEDGATGQFYGQTTLAPQGGSPFSDDRGIAERAAGEVTPSAQMTTGGGAALQARAAREELFAERAEEGWERLTNLGRGADAPDEFTTTFRPQGEGLQSVLGEEVELVDAPSSAQTGAMAFQAGEIVERGFADFGAWFREEQPLADTGPTILGEQVGNIPGRAVEFTAGATGAVLGFPGQWPATTMADVERDAVAETEQLSDPGELDAPAEVSEGATADEVAEQVAAMNPAVDRGDIAVDRQPGGEFDIATDLSQEDMRERVAEANPGVGPSDVWFTEGGDPRATTLSEDGRTPTEIQGGTLATAEQTAEAQVELALEYPLTTTALFALPAAETAGRFRTGFREGARGAEVVPAEAITTEAGAAGEIPTSETFRSGSTREAVREIGERAADQPEVVREAAGAEQVLYHTTGSRMGEPFVRAEGSTGVTDLLAGRRGQGQRAVEVGEGASELPGLFTAPEMNPVGLRNTAIPGSGSTSLTGYLRPRIPDLGGAGDRIAGFPGDRVAGMPERAAGQGYEIRGSGGERLEGGLGRGQAKQRAADIEGAEVAPDVTTAGYEYLSQEATPGTAQVKPSGIRSSEIEAIYPPESSFVQRTGGPNVDVQFGGHIFDVPRTDIQLTFGGSRVPMDAFRRAAEQPSRAGETPTGVRTVGEIAESHVTPTQARRAASERAGPSSPFTPMDALGMGESTSAFAGDRGTSLFGEPSGMIESATTGTFSGSSATTVSEPATTTTTTTTASEQPTTTATTTAPTSPGPSTPTSPGPSTPTTTIPTTPTETIPGSGPPTTPTTFIPGGGQPAGPPRGPFGDPGDRDDDEYQPLQPTGQEFINPILTGSGLLGLGGGGGGQQDAGGSIFGGGGGGNGFAEMFTGSGESQDLGPFGVF